MEAAAGWLEELGEAGGKSGVAVREFAALFPPTTTWGEPWPAGVDAELPPFRPSAASYAAALRDVMAGRRRVRVDGRWEDRPGTLSLGVVAGAWSVLAAD